MFQSTRPRGARLSISVPSPPSMVFQSTRPRGARLQSPARRAAGHLRFNPRAHGGRDCYLSRFRLRTKSFNPRAHGGRDWTRPRPLRDRRTVSIHAPTGGATSSPPSRTCCATSFNPRAHGGRDLSLLTVMPAAESFNPRAHGGRDNRSPRDRAEEDVSIHAPTGGATGLRHLVSVSCQGFNPRAHGGRDFETAMNRAGFTVFQSTRPRGARHRRASSR